jgi:hypothetical protein
MLRKSRVPAAVGLAAAMVAACSSGPKPSDLTTSLRADFAMVERLHVNIAVLSEMADCRELDYSRGAFVTDPGSEACATLVLGHGIVSAFDTQAKADAEALQRDSELHGPRLEFASAFYSDDGRLISGYFGLLGVADGYGYMPGKARDYRPDSTCGEAVDADWFRSFECRYFRWPWESW